MYNVIIIIIYNYKYEHSNIKDFSKERYNTHEIVSFYFVYKNKQQVKITYIGYICKTMDCL